MSLPLELQQKLFLVRQLIDSGNTESALQIEAQTRKDNPKQLIPSIPCELKLDEFITQDLDLIKQKDTIRILALLEDSVLIYGETGTGKEIIAKALHGSKTGKFIGINCTSLPDYLLESELFGHKKGSFTGAVEDKIGLLQAAWNGTIFLDEIGDMPPQLQAKLLRAIQEKVIRPVGSNEHIKINCRFISATHRDLKSLMKKENGGAFRKDLFYRLSTFELFIKPLRERKEDIVLIGKKLGIADNILNQWKELPFEGNVRELQWYARRYQVLGNI